MAEKNYYEILGVAKDADEAETPPRCQQRT